MVLWFSKCCPEALSGSLNPFRESVGQLFSYLPFSLHRLLYWLCESMMIFPIHLTVRTMMVLLRNIFDEIVKITNCIQFWTQEYTPFKYSVMKREVCMKHLYRILRNHGYFKKMNLCSCYSCKLLLLISWNAIFICKNEKQNVFIQIWLFGRYFLRNEFKKRVSIHPIDSYLLPMLEVELLRKD